MRNAIGKLATIVAIATVYAAVSASARADDIRVFNTGVNDSRAVLPPGTPDPHYSIVVVPAGSGFSVPRQATVARAHPVYVPNSPVGTAGSSWIAPLADTNNFFALGNYVYRTTFDLTGLDPATAVIDGTLAVDDAVTDLRLNGVSLGSLGGGFTTFAVHFHVDHGFQPGVNTLEFKVVNGGAGANPTGLRVVMGGTAAPAVPVDALPPAILGCYDRSLSWQGAPITLVAASLGITAVDAVDGSVPVTLSPSVVGLGAHQVTASAHDTAGNVASCTFTVRVLDVTPPVITGPSIATPTFEWLGSRIKLTPALLGVSALDDVGGSVPVKLTPCLVGLGDTVVSASATDAAGNSATLSFTVRAGDTTAPVFRSLRVSPDVLDKRNHSMAQVTVSASVNDAGDPEPRVRIVSIRCSDDGVTSAASLWATDWRVTGALTADVRCERSGGGDGRTYTITVECTDASGNSATATVDVFVPHDNGHSQAKRKSK